MVEKKKSPITFLLTVSTILGFYLGFTGKSLDNLGLTVESLYLGIPSLFIFLFIVALYLYWRD
jgi:ABC-type dipeptide/oligopeptide/nickel transport system permease subunit